MDSVSSANSANSSGTSGSYAPSTSKFNIGGLISGLDVDATVKKLMDIEAHPMIDLQASKTRYQTQLTAWKQLDANITAVQTSVSRLSSSSGFIAKKATSSNEDFLTVSALASAGEGSYSIAVKQLAKTHQLQLTAAASDCTITTYGTGTLTIEADGKSVDVSINSANNTLQGIAGAINNSDTNVNASVIATGDSMYQLVLTSKTSGMEGETAITASSGLTLSTFSDLQAASDAKIWIGDESSHLEVTRSSNIISDVFTGLTLNLEKVSGSDFVDVKVSSNTEATQVNVNTFITNYNKLIDYFDQQFFYDASTGEQGTLQGNTTLILIQNKLNSILFGAGGNGTLNNLAQIGIAADKSGKLSIDNMTKFNDAVTSKADDLKSLFGDSNNGIATKLKNYINGLTQANGAISSEEDLTQQEIDTVDDKMQEKTDYLARIETQYRKQFNELEKALSTLKDQQNQISGALAGLLGTSTT